MQNLKMHAVILLALLMMFMFGWNTVSGNTRVEKTDPQVIKVLTEIENEQKSITTPKRGGLKFDTERVFTQNIIHHPLR